MPMRPAIPFLVALVLLLGAIPAEAVEPTPVTPELVAAAQKEGSVVWYGSEDLQLVTAVATAFEAKYPSIKAQAERSGAERNFQRISQEYASNIHAVYVAALETGPSLVATSRDLLHSLIAIRRRWMGAIISCAYWMQQKSDARLIVRQVYDELGQSDEGLLVAHAKTAQRKVENVAAHMGITLTVVGQKQGQ